MQNPDQFLIFNLQFSLNLQWLNELLIGNWDLEIDNFVVQGEQL